MKTPHTLRPTVRAEAHAAPARAPLLEVFSSIQGEGLYLGQPQVFVRLFGCPLRCKWCDTPGSWELPPAGAEARLDLAGGRERVASRASARELAAWIEAADPGGSRPVSLTGGEPLMWPEFVRELRAALPRRRLHLETAGAFPRSLARVIDVLDHISADLKPPTDLEPPVPLAAPDGESFEEAPTDAEQWRGARRAVLAQLTGRDACLKLVVSAGRGLDEARGLLGDHARLAPDLPLFLQPATPVRGSLAPSAAELDALVDLALSLGLTTRVTPQLHRILGLP